MNSITTKTDAKYGQRCKDQEQRRDCALSQRERPYDKGDRCPAEKNRPLLNGHRYLTDDELSRLLHINRRTLQDYRNMGRISFVKLGGKVLYREEDVEKLLQENYRPRFEKP